MGLDNNFGERLTNDGISITARIYERFGPRYVVRIRSLLRRTIDAQSNHDPLPWKHGTWSDELANTERVHFPLISGSAGYGPFHEIRDAT